jgi:hypothetical protein
LTLNNNFPSKQLSILMTTCKKNCKPLNYFYIVYNISLEQHSRDQGNKTHYSSSKKVFEIVKNNFVIIWRQIAWCGIIFIKPTKNLHIVNLICVFISIKNLLLSFNKTSRLWLDSTKRNLFMLLQNLFKPLSHFELEFV